MRTKKIRGHRRIWRNIDHWIETNKTLHIDQLINDQYDYTKIRIQPWNGFSRFSSKIPEPRGKTKQKMLAGLIELYTCWKKELDKLDQPYYLKIWLFEPRFSHSQVVCALGEKLHFYTTTFYKPEEANAFNSEHYGKLSEALNQFSWEMYLDEDHLDNTQPGNPEDYATLQDYEATKKWVEQTMKRPHRTTPFEHPDEFYTEYYSFKKGFVWLGEKK